MAEKILAWKNSGGKDLAGKRPAGERLSILIEYAWIKFMSDTERCSIF